MDEDVKSQLPAPLNHISSRLDLFIIIAVFIDQGSSVLHVIVLNYIEPSFASVVSDKRETELTEENWERSDHSANQREGRWNCSIWGTPSTKQKETKLSFKLQVENFTSLLT